MSNSLTNRLDRALKNEEFVVYYQPKVDLVTGTIKEAEALIRWLSPEQGLVGPLDFIPHAEQTGQINELGKYVLSKACEQVKYWQSHDIGTIKVSVNISARQFNESNLVDFIEKTLLNLELDPRMLELELTESTLMANVDEAIEKLNQLRSMNIDISIDDFGTGYSSLSYLARFPVNALKIDQSFIKNLTTNKQNADITSAIVAMGHKLGLKVIAEGVETKEHLSYLAKVECDYIQGYYISKPLPAAGMEELLKSHTIIVIPQVC